MAFDMSVVGFFEFITRPFTNWMGWLLLALAIFYIFLRVTGKIGGTRKQGGGMQSGYDYEIK